jgi:hypothetical protein
MSNNTLTLVLLALAIGCGSTDDQTPSGYEPPASTGGESSVATTDSVASATGGSAALVTTGGQTYVVLSTGAITGGRSSAPLPTGGKPSTGGAVATGGNSATGGALPTGGQNGGVAVCDVNDSQCRCSNGTHTLQKICGGMMCCRAIDSQGLGYCFSTGCS